MIEYFKEQIDRCDVPHMILWYCLIQDEKFKLEKVAYTKKDDVVYGTENYEFVKYDKVVIESEMFGEKFVFAEDKLPFFKLRST